MRLIPLILRISRLFTAITLIAGPTGPVYAGLGAVRPSSYKEAAAAGQSSAQTASSAAVRSTGNSKLPMYFEANRGQTDASVKFFTRAAGYKLYLTSAEAVMVLPRAKADTTRTANVVRMKLKGANSKPAIQGQEMLPGYTSYFRGGDRTKWQTGVKQYNKVKLGQVYPGIDMVYRFDKGNVEYDFIVAPGANPGRILMGFQGNKGLRLDARGNLVLSVEGGELTYKAPVLYQTLGGRRVAVKGRFLLASNKNVQFEVGNYVKSQELVIDPAIMYGTFLGGTAEEKITGIKVDSTGQAYVTGYADSAPDGATGFPPTTPAVHTYPLAPQPMTNPGARDAFVAKMSADGSKLLWLAWLGGTLAEEAKGIVLEASPAVAGEPQIYITGQTFSSDFPMLKEAQVCTGMVGGESRAFVAQLTQPGDMPDLVYSTCWGGAEAQPTTGNAITLDKNNAVYVTGATTAGATFTFLPGGLAAAYKDQGVEAAFVLKLDPLSGANVAPVYSMFLGNTDTYARGNAIAVDDTLRAWVTGITASPTFLAAATGHFASAIVGAEDAFIAKVHEAGTSVLYFTYINGNDRQEGTAIALNKDGVDPYNVFVAGWTKSPTSFPSVAYKLLYTSGDRLPSYQTELPGASGESAFIVKLDPFVVNAVPGSDNPLEMVYATYVGSTDGDERAAGLALDTRDDAYITGWTLGAAGWDNASAMPDDNHITSGVAGLNVDGAVLTNTASGDPAAFVAAVSADGSLRSFFSFMGAVAAGVGQRATSIVIDPLHNMYVAGFTGANGFPTTTDSLQDGTAGSEINRGTGTGALDGFIVKIAPVLSFGVPLVVGVPPSACTITSINPSSGFAAGGSTVTIVGTNFTGINATGDVDFGVAGATYTVNSPTLISVVVPPYVVGSAPITVVTVDGNCSVNYRYLLAAESCTDGHFFPSPATGDTGNFAYCMAQDGTAKIRVYNVIGDLVAKVEEAKSAGSQFSSLNTARLAPGVYLYRLERNYGGGNSYTSGVKKFVVQH